MKSDLSLDTARVDEETVVSAIGTFDIATAPLLESAVDTALRPGDAVVLDLSGVHLCDSTGLGAMVRLHRRAEAAGARLIVRGPQPHVAETLAMTGIDKLLHIRR